MFDYNSQVRCYYIELISLCPDLESLTIALYSCRKYFKYSEIVKNIKSQRYEIEARLDHLYGDIK